MNYTPEDYEALFGEHYQPKEWTPARLMLLVVIFGLVLASWGIAGCDSRAQDAEIMQMSKDESEVLPPQAYFQFPLPYTATVTQCDTKKGCRTRFYVPRTKQ